MAASSLIQELFASRFAKLAGLKISGTVPLRQELVNEALGELVRNWSSGGAQAGPPAPPQSKPSYPPLPEILSLVQKIEVRAEKDVIHVDFEIGV